MPTTPPPNGPVAMTDASTLQAVLSASYTEHRDIESSLANGQIVGSATTRWRYRATVELSRSIAGFWTGTGTGAGSWEEFQTIDESGHGWIEYAHAHLAGAGPDDVLASLSLGLHDGIPDLSLWAAPIEFAVESDSFMYSRSPVSADPGGSSSVSGAGRRTVYFPHVSAVELGPDETQWSGSRTTTQAAPPSSLEQIWTVRPISTRRITLRVVDGATRERVAAPKTWAAVRKTGGSVIVEATTLPDDSPAEWHRIRWSGPGRPVKGAPNRRRLSRSMAKRLHVTATLDGSSDEIDVWILWSRVEIRTNGVRPGNAAPFPPFTADGTDRLGATTYLSLVSSVIDPGTGALVRNMGAAGKVCAVATIVPKGAAAAVPAGWAIHRHLQARTWLDGRPVTGGKNWADDWIDDTSPPHQLRLTPDPDGRIYDLDAPDIRWGQSAYETYNNFRQSVSWNGEPCSEPAQWRWNCRWRLDPNPGSQITLADVGTGHRRLPTGPHYRLGGQ